MKKIHYLRKIGAVILAIVFGLSSTGFERYVYAQTVAPPPSLQVNGPIASPLLTLTDSFQPVLLKGLRIDPENPLQFDFIIDQGDSGMVGDSLEVESAKLIKYFLASLAIPEPDLWVNLSPYEEERIIPETFGQTEMGRDLLAQDYLLKQLTASLLHPDSEYGARFWKRIYEEAQNEYGTVDITHDTFSKIWIMPQRAKIYEGDGVAYLLESQLKVMLEKDYLAQEKHQAIAATTEDNPLDAMSEKFVREIIIPAISREVNEGQHFAQLRQIYSAFILANWYKTKMKNTLLNQLYSDNRKVSGVNHDNPDAAHDIWKQYTSIFEDGIYNVIKEEYDPVKQDVIERKYFSGGVILDSDQSGLDSISSSVDDINDIASRSVKLSSVRVDMAVLADETKRSFFKTFRTTVIGTALSFMLTLPFYTELAKSGNVTASLQAQWNYMDKTASYLISQVKAAIEVEDENGDIQLEPVYVEPLIKYGLVTNDLGEADLITEIAQDNERYREKRPPVVEQREVRISLLTGQPLTYSQDEFNISKLKVIYVVDNFHSYWRSSASVDDVFHPGKKMFMTLDRFVEIVIDGYHNIPGLKERFSSPEELAGWLTATIAKESSFNARAVEQVTLVDKNGKKYTVNKAQGMLQFDRPSYWTSLLPDEKKDVPEWSFIEGRFNPEVTLYMGMHRLAEKAEAQEEFNQIKALHGTENWPGDEAVRIALYALNHNRGSNFTLANKAAVIKKLFSTDDTQSKYYHAIYINARKILSFYGFIKITKKGKVLEVYRESPDVLASAENVGGIDLDATQMELEMTGDNGVDCALYPEHSSCIQLNITPEQLEEMRQNIEGIVPIIINIQPLPNLPLFLGVQEPKNNDSFEEALSSI